MFFFIISAKLFTIKLIYVATLNVSTNVFIAVCTATTDHTTTILLSSIVACVVFTASIIIFQVIRWYGFIVSIVQSNMTKTASIFSFFSFHQVIRWYGFIYLRFFVILLCTMETMLFIAWYQLTSHQQVTYLTFLELYTAFDTIDHTVLLERLSSWIEISSSALFWIKSYLINRFFLCILKTLLSVFHLLYEVPQGSVLGSILLILYSQYCNI